MPICTFHSAAVTNFTQLVAFLGCAKYGVVNSIVLQAFIYIENPILVMKPTYWSCYGSASCGLDVSGNLSSSPVTFSTNKHTIVDLTINGGGAPHDFVSGCTTAICRALIRV